MIRQPNFRGQESVSLLKRADVRTTRLYDLRHTRATLLLQANVNVKVLSQRLGHEGIAITLKQGPTAISQKAGKEEGGSTEGKAG